MRRVTGIGFVPQAIVVCVEWLRARIVKIWGVSGAHLAGGENTRWSLLTLRCSLFVSEMKESFQGRLRIHGGR